MLDPWHRPNLYHDIRGTPHTIFQCLNLSKKEQRFENWSQSKRQAPVQTNHNEHKDRYNPYKLNKAQLTSSTIPAVTQAQPMSPTDDICKQDIFHKTGRKARRTILASSPHPEIHIRSSNGFSAEKKFQKVGKQSF